MLIRHLDFFVTLAEERHFGRAAELCGVSQPALSLAIRKLEEDLGTTLILRGKSFQGLTAEGEKVLVWGRQILSGYGNLRDDLGGRRKGGLTGTLRLGVMASAMPLLPLLAARFEARNPLASIAIRLLSQDAIRDGLDEFSLDGALTLLDDRPAKGLVAVALRQAPMVFACRNDHPFAPGPSIAWGDAATQPLCATEDVIRTHMAPRNIRAAISCSSLDAVLALLREGSWCAILPGGFADLLAPQDDITLLPLTLPEVTQSTGILLVQRDPQSPMVQALHDCARSLVGL